MALANYTDLKATIADYLARTDLTSVIPTFITLAEIRMGRDVRIMEMLNQTTLSITSASANMPSDFLELREIHFDTDPTVPLEYQTPEQFYANGLQNNAGQPVYFSFIDNTIKFSPTGTPATVSVLYYAQPPELSGSNLTNVFTDNCMDALLYASLAESAPYLMDDTRIQTWATMYDRAIQNIYKNNLGKTSPNTSLSVKAG